MSDPPPCPFCGGKAEPFAEAGYWWIACHSCGISTGGRKRLSDAETIWARRTAPPATRELFRAFEEHLYNRGLVKAFGLHVGSFASKVLAEWPEPAKDPS